VVVSPDGGAGEGPLSAGEISSSFKNCSGVLRLATIVSGKAGASSGGAAAVSIAAGAACSSGTGGITENNAAISGCVKIGISAPAEKRSSKLPVTSSGPVSARGRSVAAGKMSAAASTAADAKP
jgi:hypothetical protein